MKIQFLEETILLVSAFWMFIYLYGTDQTNHFAYHPILLLCPILLIFFTVLIILKKKNG
jgi:hypothetical protein